jgi:hypothetical protein
MIQITEEAGRLLRQMAKAETTTVRLRIAADLLAETGYIANTKQHKAMWRDGR